MFDFKEYFRVTKEFLKLVPVLAVKPPSNEDAVSMATVLEDTVAKYAGRSMIIFEGRELTWGQFNALTNQIAHALIARGVQRGDCVSLIMENRIEMLACTFALQKIGAISSLINYALTGAQLAHCVTVSGSSKCLVGEEIYSNLDAVRGDLALGDKEILWVADQRSNPVPTNAEDIVAVLEQYPTTNLEDTKTILAGSTAMYIFTSGTTGMPKAAKIPHRRWMSAAHAFGLAGCQAKPSDRFYLCLPLFHGTGLICGIGSAFYTGASIFLRRRFSASEFWSDVHKYKTTNFIYVGELCRYLLAQPVSPFEQNNSLTRVFGNGLRPDIWDEFKQRFGIERVCEFYGSSEGNVSFFNALNKNRTMGITPATVMLVKYDIDADEMVRDANGKLIQVPVGEPGLLLGEIDDRFKFDGYTNDDATESKVLRDVVKPGDAWFNTGDLICEIDVGFALGKPHYQFVDRVGDTFRWRSENVSTNEVGEILNGCGQVEMANVYGVDIPATEGKAGMVSLLLKPGQEFDAEAFSTFVNANLTHFSQPVFVRVQPEAATTGTFKLLKGDLRKQAFHVDLVTDELYVMPPRASQYQKLERDLYDKIMDGSAGY
ncbi:long-chain-acyl-CoA synthetase [Porticoccaceae bacterium]|jgi:citronellyl-CoA synthetase|nr:long-chain-acyl-CoA synthetase [Porticoccaceae bacterium]